MRKRDAAAGEFVGPVGAGLLGVVGVPGAVGAVGLVGLVGVEPPLGVVVVVVSLLPLPPPQAVSQINSALAAAPRMNRAATPARVWATCIFCTSTPDGASLHRREGTQPLCLPHRVRS